MKDKLRINRKHQIEIDNIKYIKIKGNIVWIYLRNSYPPILKTDYNYDKLKLMLLNMGITPLSIEVKL